MPPSPPGWYPHDGAERYWNGSEWTKRTRPASTASTSPTPPAPAQGSAQAVMPYNQPGAAAHYRPQTSQPGAALPSPTYPSYPPPGHGPAAQQQPATPSAPAGWYHRNGRQQWWDGTTWQERYQSATSPAGPFEHQLTTASGQAVLPHPPHPGVVRKSAVLYLLASFFVTGLGSLLVGRTNNGLIQILGGISSWIIMLTFGIFIFPLFVMCPMVSMGLWVWGMVDAAQGATEWNRRHGFPD